MVVPGILHAFMVCLYQRATVQRRVDGDTGGIAVALREAWTTSSVQEPGDVVVRSCGEEIQTRFVLNVACSRLSETLRALNKAEPERFQHLDIRTCTGYSAH